MIADVVCSLKIFPYAKQLENDAFAEISLIDLNLFGEIGLFPLD